MATKLQNFKLPVELIEKIESLNGEGNKTALVVDLLNQALSIRSIEDQQREFMYVGVKRYFSERDIFIDPKLSRNIIDGLWI